MKAVIFNKPGNWVNVLEEKDVEIGEPATNEVQIKIFCRPINPSDDMFIQGVYRVKPAPPQIAGLEGAGVITKCGNNIDPAYLNCRVMFRAKGTWAEYINLPIDQIRLVPSEIEFEIACQLSLNTLTAYALLETAKVNEDDYLLLTAATSSVAQQTIQFAKERNIRTIAIIRNDSHIKKLEDLGADYIVNSEKADLIHFLETKNIKGVHASLDAVGGPLGSTLIKAAGAFGRIIIYGRLTPDPANFTNADIIYKNLVISGFGIDAWINTKTKEELDNIWEEIYRSVIRKTLIVHYDKIFTIDQFKMAIQSYKAGDGRILIN